MAEMRQFNRYGTGDEATCAARWVDYLHALTTSAAASRVVGKSMIAQAASFHFGGSLDQSNLGM
jgi:hypothetical protein